MLHIPNRFLLITLIVLVPACRRAGSDVFKSNENYSETIKINGILKNGAGKPVYLDLMGAREFFPVDTVVCNDQETFQMEFHAEQTSFYALRCSEQGYVTLLLAPGEVVDFSGNHQSANPYTVSGSEGSELIQQLAGMHKKTISAMAEISRKNRESINDPDYQSIKVLLDNRFDSLATAFYDYSVRFIHDHPQSLSILIALYNQYGYGLPVFNPDADMELFQFVDSSLTRLYPENEAVKMLKAQIQSAGKQAEPFQSGSKLEIGDKAPDFLINNPDGNPVTMKQFRGKYVLLSFWAAWSKPCREENEVLREAFRKFGDRTFDIFQVSLDDNKSLWINAIKSDSLSWSHASDLKRWESKVNDIYFIEKIPSNYLISPDGIIIGKDLFGPDLIEALTLLFK